MTPAERIAKVAELRAEADRLESEGKRNWPERVEAGMLFRGLPGSEGEGRLFVTAEDDDFFLLDLSTGCFFNRGKYFWKEAPWLEYEFLGLSDLLTIKTPDAPEPTGAGLVGKVCEFSDDGKKWESAHRCTGHNPADGYKCSCGSWSKFARLAKEQP